MLSILVEGMTDCGLDPVIPGSGSEQGERLKGMTDCGLDPETLI